MLACQNCEAVLTPANIYTQIIPELSDDNMRIYCGKDCAHANVRKMQSPFIRDRVVDLNHMLVLCEKLHSSLLSIKHLYLPTEGRARKSSMSTFANITEEIAFNALRVRVTKLVIRTYELLLKRNPIYRLFKNKVQEEFVELQFMCPNDKLMQQVSMQMKDFAFIASFERFFV